MLRSSELVAAIRLKQRYAGHGPSDLPISKENISYTYGSYHLARQHHDFKGVSERDIGVALAEIFKGFTQNTEKIGQIGRAKITDYTRVNEASQIYVATGRLVHVTLEKCSGDFPRTARQILVTGPHSLAKDMHRSLEDYVAKHPPLNVKVPF